jgi:F0F1-type ATP synthase epsilon subunit
MSLLQPTGASSETIHAESTSKTTSTLTAFEKRNPVKGRLLVKIYTPFHTFFEGDARSLTAVNESGEFDILPGHHNFITMLLACDVRVVTGDNDKEIIPILRGLLHVKQDKLIIFLDV